MAEHEDVAMWERYCRPKTLGIALRTTYRRLDAAVSRTILKDRHVMMGLVSYGDFRSPSFTSDPSNVFSTFMLKKIEYSSERELRIISDVFNGAKVAGLPVPVDLDMLIGEVVFSPYMNPSLARGLEGAWRRKGYKFAIRQSAVLNVATVY
jgi:hypothetical protein